MSGRETKRLWYLEHREEHKKSCRDHNKELRRKALEVLGNACCRCGFSDTRALQIDHKNGFGRQEKLSHGGHLNEVYNKIIKREDNDAYRLLCANCNTIKAVEEKELSRGL